MFANPWNCVYSAKKLDADQNFYDTNVMGTGPFVFEEYVKGSHWSAKRFDNYFQKGKPYLDGIRGFFINGPGVVNALAGGQVDALLFQVAPPDQARLKSLRGDAVVFHQNSFNITNFLTVNVKKPPFNDPRVRKALEPRRSTGRAGIPSLAKLATLEFPTVYVPPASSRSPIRRRRWRSFPASASDIDKQREEAKSCLPKPACPI